MNKKVTFGDLRHLLEELGFRTTRRPPHVLFTHEPSGTVIPLRGYRSAETVRPADLAVVRTMLDQRGLMEEAAFDRALLTADK
jgi:hypothetical protein